MISSSPPARADSAERMANPALSMRGTWARSRLVAPVSDASAGAHAPGTSSRSRLPLNTRASPWRRTRGASEAGIHLHLAAAQLVGHLADRLVLQLVVELAAERADEAHAFHLHVEHLPLPAALAHQEGHRDRLAALAQQLAGHAHAQPARQRRLGDDARLQAGVEVQQGGTVAA